jgi:hypothetical protein
MLENQELMKLLVTDVADSEALAPSAKFLWFKGTFVAFIL